jgi:hypothetical protein
MRRFIIHPSAFLIAVLTLVSSTRAADVWSLTSADLSTIAVQLIRLDRNGVKIANVDGNNERLIPMAQFVEIERPLPASPAAGKFVLHLTTGDNLSGEPAGVQGESIRWKSATLGEIPVPLCELRAIARPGVRFSDAQGKEDVVTLTNRDVVRGTIADLSATKLALQSDAGPADVPLDSVTSLVFAATAQAGGKDKAGFRVRFDDGSSIVGSSVEVAGGKIKLAVGDAPARDVDLAKVAAIEQVNGPVSWLSSRTPHQSVYTPFLGSRQDRPARMNTNVRGGPIRFGERTFTRGIGVHSYSRLVFNIEPGKYAAFRTRYAIDPSTEFAGADVTVRIRLDDRIVHEQHHVRVGTLSPVVVADLGNAKSVTLEADYGAGISSGDLLNWIEPALMTVKPAMPQAHQGLPGGRLSIRSLRLYFV